MYRTGRFLSKKRSKPGNTRMLCLGNTPVSKKNISAKLNCDLCLFTLTCMLRRIHSSVSLSCFQWTSRIEQFSSAVLEHYRAACVEVSSSVQMLLLNTKWFFLPLIYHPRRSELKMIDWTNPDISNTLQWEMCRNVLLETLPSKRIS